MIFPDMSVRIKMDRRMTRNQETTVAAKEDLDLEGGEFPVDGEESFLQ